MSREAPERKNYIYLGMSRGQKILLFTVVALTVVSCVLIVMWKAFEVTKVNVTGNRHYTVEQIKDMVMTGPLGHNSLYLSAKYRNSSVEGVPFVETMDVKILSPSSISITVYEKAIAGCVGYLDRYMYFDKDGIVVETSSVRHTDLPYVTGLDFDHVVLYEKLPVENEEIFKSILTITQLLSKYDVVSDRIYFDSDMEVTLYFGKARVQMGSMDNIDEKMMKLQGIAPKLGDLSGVLHMETYDGDSKTGYITFQRDDTKRHEELSDELLEEGAEEGSGEAAGDEAGGNAEGTPESKESVDTDGAE